MTCPPAIRTLVFSASVFLLSVPAYTDSLGGSAQTGEHIQNEIRIQQLIADRAHENALAARRQAEVQLTNTIAADPDDKGAIQSATIRLRVAESELEKVRDLRNRIQNLVTRMNTELTRATALRKESLNAGEDKRKDIRAAMELALEKASSAATDITDIVDRLRHRWLNPRPPEDAEPGADE